MRARKRNWLRCAVAAGGVLVALGVGATSALGQGTYTLNLSAQPSAGVGQTVIIQASGFNPPGPIITFYSYLTVVAIPTSVVSACPADYQSGKQVARSTEGGEVVDEHHREDADAAGNFSMPVAYTPRLPGRFLLCGYSDDAATTTLATASLVLNVEGSAGSGSGPSPIAKPASVERPRVRQAATRLVCQRGSWSNNPSRYSYRWLVNGRRKAGARGRTLGLTRSLRGRKVQCRVTAHNAAGAATALSRGARIR